MTYLDAIGRLFVFQAWVDGRLALFQVAIAAEAAVLALILGLYGLPAIIARWQKSPRFEAVLLVNLFAGWTLVGWMIALVLGAVRPKPLVTVPVMVVGQPVVMIAPQLPPGPRHGRR